MEEITPGNPGHNHPQHLIIVSHHCRRPCQYFVRDGQEEKEKCSPAEVHHLLPSEAQESAGHQAGL